MKVVLYILGIILLLGIGYGVYHFSTNNELSVKSLFNKQIEKKIDNSLQEGTDYINKQIQSWSQYIASWAQNLLQSWQNYFDEKKQQAEEFIKDTKQQVKDDLQKKAEDEAKNAIESFFNRY